MYWHIWRRQRTKTWGLARWLFHASETAVLRRALKTCRQARHVQITQPGQGALQKATASTVRRCRHLTAEKIQLHARED